jgi:hypothetical protein
MSSSGSSTATYSGGNISTVWPQLGVASMVASMNEMEGITASANDANHSMTMFYNNFSTPMYDEMLTEFQINQNGTKFKRAQLGIEMIYTKQ